ncbi:MAG: outer membrane porin, OprD family [Proteobacteria bacterium]|nr:MAG: outer membrane porin, OprD family [Pseudomonadota bacterium]
MPRQSGGQVNRAGALGAIEAPHRFGGEGDAYVFYGGDYEVNKLTNIGLHYGKLEDVYQQYVANMSTAFPFGNSISVKVDLRFAKSQEDGSYRDVDNKALGGMFTYRVGAQSFGVGYQKMHGNDPYPYVSNSDPYLVNFIQINDFANINERSWQARYDVDLAAIGVPGLALMTRYVRGDEVRLTSGSQGEEWERDTDITYAFQSGPLKNLSLRWRNATVRSTFGNNLDENRLIVQYMIPIL